jgi:hypothetical protein
MKSIINKYKTRDNIDNYVWRKRYIEEVVKNHATGESVTPERLLEGQRYVKNVLNENLSETDAFITLLPISSDKKYKKKLDKLINQWVRDTQNYNLKIRTFEEDTTDNGTTITFPPEALTGKNVDNDYMNKIIRGVHQILKELK